MLYQRIFNGFTERPCGSLEGAGPDQGHTRARDQFRQGVARPVGGGEAGSKELLKQREIKNIECSEKA